MRIRIAIIWGLAVWLLAFCSFIMLYEHFDQRRHKPRMQEHIVVIAEALWKLDPSGAQEYLTLATKLDNYEFITITDDKGAVFLRVDGPPLNNIDQIFSSIGLIHSSQQTAPIIRQGTTIGDLTALVRHDTIYANLYTFLVLGLLFVTYVLFLRIIAAKRNLADRVIERTAELLEANEELLREKDFSDDVIEALPGMFILYDEHGRIIQWNKETLNMTGYTEEEFVQVNPANLFEDNDQALASSNPETGVVPNRSQMETELITKDGGKVSCYVTRIPTELDGKTHIMCGGLDITERKQAEQATAVLKDQLHQSQKMEAIGQLAGGIAHDFNNLLMAIIGNADLLESSLPSKSTEAEYTQDILKASSRAADLTKQLLAFSRKGRIQKIPVDVHSIITEVAGLLDRSIDKNIEIVNVLEASSANVIGDPTQLLSSLLNLAVNGRDAMPEGGKLTFSTKTLLLDEALCQEYGEGLVPGKYIKIAVTDTGSGMDDEIQKRIFEPFFTTKIQGKGTGLGLASTYGCVIEHQGTINIDSEIGHGSTFNILLPLALETATETATDQQAPIMGRGHILVIDDEETVLQSTKNTLSHLGYKATCFNNGQEAVQFFSLHHAEVDLVILDLIMPNMNGEAVFGFLKDIDPAVRIIIASGFTQTSVADSLAEKGVLDFLNKPYRTDDLARHIARHLEI